MFRFCCGWNLFAWAYYTICWDVDVKVTSEFQKLPRQSIANCYKTLACSATKNRLLISCVTEVARVVFRAKRQSVTSWSNGRLHKLECETKPRLTVLCKTKRNQIKAYCTLELPCFGKPNETKRDETKAYCTLENQTKPNQGLLYIAKTRRS